MGEILENGLTKMKLLLEFDTFDFLRTAGQEFFDYVEPLHAYIFR